MGVAGHGVDLAVVGLHDAALVVLHGQPYVAQIHLARRPLGHRPAPQSVPLRAAEEAADEEAVARIAEPVALVAVGEEVFLVSQPHAADRKVLLVEHAGRTFEAELAAIVALVAGELVEILPQLRVAVRGDEPRADHEDAAVRRAPQVLRPGAFAMRMRLEGLQVCKVVDGHAVGPERRGPQSVSHRIEREILAHRPAEPIPGRDDRLHLIHLRPSVAVEIAPDEQQLLAVDGGEPLAEIVTAIEVSPRGQGADGGHGQRHAVALLAHRGDRVVFQAHEIPMVAEGYWPIWRRRAGEAARIVVAMHHAFEFPVPLVPVDAKKHAVVEKP